MPTLILQLPLPSGTEAPAYDYVLTSDGLQETSHGHAVAAMLPAHGTRGLEVVAVVPVQAVSWHRLALPEKVLRSMLSGRTEASRTRGVLTGALEERLLDDPGELHFAVFAAVPQETGDTTNAWVAVCDRTWLRNNLQALETAGFTVTRIAAECAPEPEGAGQLLVTGDAQQAHVVWSSAQGVARLPLPAGLARLPDADNLPVVAEPGAMEQAAKAFGNRIQAQTRVQRLLAAAQAPWNLAQLELSASAGTRMAKQWSAFGQQLVRGPQWRPVRWGLLAWWSFRSWR